MTNRAADLTALLDAMGQGIQTIEAANQGIEHAITMLAITMLEQAQAVANSALEKGEEEIIARVATEDELRQAISSGKEGLIVITQDITNISSSIELKDGQSLVGVSYLDKNVAATKLTFDFDVDNEQHGIIAGNNSLVAGLDIDFSSTYKKNQFVAAIYADGVSNVKVLDVNLNITSKSTDVGFYGVFGIMAKNGAEIEISGDNDINLSGYRAVGVFAYRTSQIDINGQIDFFLNDSAQWGIWSHTQSTININSTAVLNLEIKVENNVICLNSLAFTNIYAGASVSMITTGSGGNFFVVKNEYGSDSSSYQEGNGIFLIEKGVNISVKATAEGIDFGGVVSNDLFLDQTEQSLGNPEDYPDNIVQTGTAQTYQMKVDGNKNQDSDTFNKIIKEYDKLLSDCSYQGINLLKGGNLKVVFDENRTHVFNVLGQDITSKALNINEALWQNQGDIEDVINQLNTSITTLRSLAENLGNQYSIITTRINFTGGLTDILETGADNITLADMNEASAQYLSLQTRQQLAINSLSLASMSARSILSLFY